MDAKTDGQYARVPELEDLVKLCRSLNEAGAAYVLIGGFAVILQGGVRATKDIDFLVDASEENIRKIKKAMSFLPDNAASLIADAEVQKYQVVRIADEFVVDLLAKACSLSYADVKSGIEWKEVDGVKIPVASKMFLIKMKETLREVDKMDVAFLKRLIETELKNKS